MKNVTVIGGGVLGSQIAFQVAYSGFRVKVWLRSESSIERTKAKLEKLRKTYVDSINDMKNKKTQNWCYGISNFENFNADECLKKISNAYDNITLELDLEESIKDADLIIESMSEDFKAKRDLYKKISPFVRRDTIVVTNSSTMLPSKLARYTKYPDMFLALHFANSIWKNNIVEVMKHSKTDDECFNKVLLFAKEINMIPLPLYKEKAGYLLNSMLIPFLFSALDLYATGVSDPEHIDTAWTIGTGSDEGPFHMLDIIGLKTAYEIVKMYVKIPSCLSPYHFKAIAKKLESYIDKGKLGKASGEGFFKY